jgi:ABC-type lipoprotein export system ATPase subunit
MSEPLVLVQGLHKSYRLGKVDLHVLRGVSFGLTEGSFTAVVGASGSGKSTLLHMVGLLDRPDRGKIVFAGRDVTSLPARRRNEIRCRDVGFVFQFYHLLGELNVLENVLLPAKVDSSVFAWARRRGQARRTAMGFLDRLGLRDRLRHRPKELSGGERQRVAVARALMNRPRVLLADEPTGNLDSASGRGILDLLKQSNRRDGQTILMVTHDISLAEQTDKVLALRDGQLSEA